ncbi:hypothetical protein ESY86_00835 [Subsaximicrobium wynnwilliamsii]|jgi:Trk-type K+ transport system membrane component|uniref:DUF4190 domain-containing protein n=1 Tax=Subsaximicrobium wynnwilliamsii TaxID=291179 RepID=A0A5C6ZM78_9FLAO|nr:CCC motif membrane protein [Subsaximicrobium wynnwilliamsii]TXD85123.1 hypothetical protein ESY87_02005 [Subsaximicrobium wynnwilliamsii]TXD91166.1 hypothetical protein ESY86_00835 [Subsaximicrobium wynnwilliamsii]TXE04560.1 hypothetical protein ESY88_03485 [Subsaximicrobium wynnwilliamsii]
MEQQKLSPVLVYVLAILGLLCCCLGGIGFIFAGIALIIAMNKLKEAQADPELYDPASVKQMNTAKLVAMIILIINVVYLLYTAYRIYTIGWDEIMLQWEDMMEQIQQQQNQ